MAGYYGGYLGNEAGMQGASQVARNIPVGEDPLLPMDREQFDDWVKYNLDKNKPLRPRDTQPPSTGPQLPGFVKGAFLPGAPGNIGAIASDIPQGPNTPLPAPGWNPGMIKPPGDPSYRPAPMWERIGPAGNTMPWQQASLPAGFQNKFVS